MFQVYIEIVFLLSFFPLSSFDDADLIDNNVLRKECNQNDDTTTLSSGTTSGPTNGTTTLSPDTRWSETTVTVTSSISTKHVSQGSKY